MKWKYLVQVTSEKLLDLNDLGKFGWELVAYTERPGVGGLQRTYIFKQPLVEDIKKKT